MNTLSLIQAACQAFATRLNTNLAPYRLDVAVASVAIVVPPTPSLNTTRRSTALGHTDASMTRRYLRDRGVKVVQGPSIVHVQNKRAKS